MDSLSAFIAESFHLSFENNGLSTRTRLYTQIERFMRKGSIYGRRKLLWRKSK